MSLVNYSIDAIRDAIAREEARRAAADMECERLGAEIRELHERMAPHTQIKVEAERRAELLGQALFVRERLPLDLEPQRRALTELRTQAAREDITVAESKRLSSEVASASAAFKACCGHALIIDYEGYSDSYGDERHEPAERLCLVCKTHEYRSGRSISDARREYETLANAAHRVIGNVRREALHASRHADVSVPVEELARVFVDENTLCLI